MDWTWKKYRELNNDELFDILQLRQQVFVVEQNCAYPDIDQMDKIAWHLCGYDASKLFAYLRVRPPTEKVPMVTIGRVVTAPSVRGEGIGKDLFSEGMKFVRQQYPRTNIKISAQTQLEKFYNQFGFSKASDPYDDDGIMHIDMHRTEA